jgi:hypothetical protein
MILGLAEKPLAKSLKSQSGEIVEDDHGIGIVYM